MALEPIFIDGKRDKARRYRDTETGEIISRRQQIKRTEGVTPEVKALIPSRRMRKGKPRKGLIQLAGTYELLNQDTNATTIEDGYSTAQPKRDYPLMHPQAVNMAIATAAYENETPSGAWVLKRIIRESWFTF